MRIKSHARVAVTALTAAGMLAGFGGLSMAAPVHGRRAIAAAPKTLSFYIIDDGIGFDPALWSWDAHEDQIGIFEGLVHFGPKDKPVPGVAASWQNKGKTWIFHLRKNARFSNGDRVTAQDFVYSIERAVNPATAQGTEHSSSWFGDVPLVNAPQIVAGQKPPSSLGVKALNAYTLEFQLSKPDPTLLQQLALDPWQLPVDPRVVSKMSYKDWTNPKDIVGDGPYMIQTYKTGISATLVPNPYYRPKPAIPQIRLIYTSSTDGLLAYKNGAEDIATLSATDVPAAKNNPVLRSQLHYEQAAIQYTFRVRPSQNPLLTDNQKVREAFAMAINKNIITQRILNGTGTPAYSAHLPTSVAPWVKGAAYPYNPAKARQLMKEAGYPGGKGFPTVVLLDAGTTDHVAEAVQQMWQQTLGVHVQLEMEEWGTFVSDLGKQLPKNEVGFYQWGDNGTYPFLALPSSLANIASLTWSWMPLDALPPAAYAQYYQINSNQSLKTPVKLAREDHLILSHLPKSDVNLIKLGVKASTTHNTTLMHQYFLRIGRLAYNIPVYTVVNPLLIKPWVKGFYPVVWWDTDPPVWLGYLR